MKAYHAIKRGMDIVISIMGIIPLIPLFALIAILIKTTSKGPVIYEHPRIGKHGKPFEIYKFRSMIVGAREQEAKGVPLEQLKTPVGRFLRKTFLDETAQLFNVLKGDISLIGPRPLDREVFEKVVRNDERWKYLFNIKPGLTSIESVADYLPKKERIRFEEHFKGLVKEDIYTEFYKHRYILDSYYVKHESPKLDALIIFYTTFLTFKRLFEKKAEDTNMFNS